MKISISNRYRPYSHLPGTYCLIPGTELRAQVFPTLLRIEDISKVEPQFVEDIKLPVEGPVKDFTVTCDFERGNVFVQGVANNEFFRFWIEVSEDGKKVKLSKKSSSGHPISKERLSLGNSKAQDWDLILRRKDLTEILPIWHRLGLLHSNISSQKKEGTALLIDNCEKAISSNAPETIYPELLRLFLAGFKGILTPRLNDDQFQGVVEFRKICNKDLSPLILLSEGAKLIRSLFVQTSEKIIKVLPSLPPEFHCGRYIDIPIENLGTLNIEWSKKKIRRAIFHSQVNEPIYFQFKHVSSYRLRSSEREKGIRVLNNESIQIEAEKTYLLDNFE